MSIQFQCERCGHAFDVDDRFEGKHGSCKHCGHSVVVPGRQANPEASAPPLRLRPLDGDDSSGAVDPRLAAPPPLKVRAATADPKIIVEMISDVDEPPSKQQRGEPNYTVVTPDHRTRARSSSGPPPDWKLVPVRTARWVASHLRTLRDWLYVASVFCLVVVLIGYLFQLKTLLHLGAAGVVASNVGMLYVGVAYLVSLPFKESLGQGLANLLIPFYAVYYWWAHWPKMKPAVYKTLGSFVPIALVGLAYLVYKEAPVVKHAVEKRLPALESKLDRAATTLESKADRALAPLEKRVGPLVKPESN